MGSATFALGAPTRRHGNVSHPVLDGVDLTAIVIPLVGGRALSVCVAALQAQGASVVVTSDEGCSKGRLPRLHEGRSVPALRQLGLDTAQTPLIAFVEDTCVPGADWVGRICKEFQNPQVGAVGGAIDISLQLPPRFRALGLCEYAEFQNFGPREGCLRSGRSRNVSSLAGAAFAFRAEALRQLPQRKEGLMDSDIFEGLSQAGWLVRLDPAAVATYTAPFEKGAWLSTRFHHGRIYGGQLGAEKGVMARIAQGLLSVLVPALLIARTYRRTPGWAWRSPSTLGWIALMQLAWGAGEGVGKATGNAGRSLRHWS